MMRKIILLLSLILSSALHAQNTYRPLLDSYNEWQITSCYFGCQDDVYYTAKDTTINGKNYHVLDGFHYISNSFLLREDTTERKIYLLFLNGGNSLEYKLYDFSLSIGDSTKVYNPVSPLPQYAGYYVLDSIKTQTLVDGEDYRHFYLTSSSPQISQSTHTVWIEGIGSKSLINTPGKDADVNGVGKLSCFFSDLTLHYSNEDSTNACEQANIDLSNDLFQQNNIKIYPNPSNGSVMIDNDYSENITYTIYNVKGQKVSYNNLSKNTSESLDIGKYGKGIYFILIHHNKFTATKKIVIY